MKRIVCAAFALMSLLVVLQPVAGGSAESVMLFTTPSEALPASVYYYETTLGEAPAPAPTEAPLEVPFKEATLSETTVTPAQGEALLPNDADSSQDGPLKVTREYRWFVNAYRNKRGVTVSYYDNVYAYNHGTYGVTPFASTVPQTYFVVDESGHYALAPIVLDITDAMRERLYGADVGETALYYGQYCERVRDKKGDLGFSGIHEGIDFRNAPGCTLHAILSGVVTRAGDQNGTVAIYSEQYNLTLLYLHCESIQVRRGDVLEAGSPIAVEGDKKAGSTYTHVEMRFGRHTSSSPYRDTKLTSDCPYSAMREALGVVDSGRQPITMAAVLEAQRMREEAEAAALAAQQAAEAAAAEAARQKELEEMPELIDVLPSANTPYGFGSDSSNGAAATPTPIPEATLPPA